MLTIHKASFPSAHQFYMAISGMRNPYNSWDKMDSFICEGENSELCSVNCPRYKGDKCTNDIKEDTFVFGFFDCTLANRLIESGSEHRKFLRQLPVSFEITAPLYWWKQMDQYKIGTVTDSCSTMHTLTKEPFTKEDFSMDNMEAICFEVIDKLNQYREKYIETGDRKYWDSINQLLPQSYNQRRTWTGSYENLYNITHQREGHKLKEWKSFIHFVEDHCPYAKNIIYYNPQSR